MPVTFLIWDAQLYSAHLTAAHTDSTLLHTSVMLAPPEEDDKKEREEERNKGWTGIGKFSSFFLVAQKFERHFCNDPSVRYNTYIHL